ncbi:MAG TPA: hypothetical protein VGM81_13260 [Burkholderiaceae bacterium]
MASQNALTVADYLLLLLRLRELAAAAGFGASVKRINARVGVLIDHTLVAHVLAELQAATTQLSTRP